MELIVCDREECYGAAMSALFNSWKRFDRTSTVSTTSQLVDQLKKAESPLALICNSLGNWTMAEVVEQVKCRHIHAKVVAVLEAKNNPRTRSVIDAKPDGIVASNAPVDEFYRCFLDVVVDKTFRSDFFKTIRRFDSAVNKANRPHEYLTPRQQDVLRWLAHGYSVKEIAALMKLSPKSVDSHKYRIMRKLKINDRVHLARYAIREGLIEP